VLQWLTEQLLLLLQGHWLKWQGLRWLVLLLLLLLLLLRSECQHAPGNDDTSSCCGCKSPAVLLHQEGMEQIKRLPRHATRCHAGRLLLLLRRRSPLWL
jgi:hypothetical protein